MVRSLGCQRNTLLRSNSYNSSQMSCFTTTGQQSRRMQEIATPEARLWREIYSGKRTEWSPIRSVIIRGITKSDDREAGV